MITQCKQGAEALNEVGMLRQEVAELRILVFMLSKHLSGGNPDWWEDIQARSVRE